MNKIECHCGYIAYTLTDFRAVSLACKHEFNNKEHKCSITLVPLNLDTFERKG